MSSPSTSLLERWGSGQPTFGAWCVIPGTISAQRIADIGFDYVCVDQQHGAIGYSDSVPMLQVLSGRTTPITRVHWNDPGTIMKALDAGAEGVVVPLVSTAQDAAAAAAACRYPPEGQRSYGPVVASMTMGTRRPEELARVACIVMVETQEGLDNLDEICETPGVDAIYVGPADLALSLGLPPAYEHDEPRHADAITKIRDACQRHGVVAGIHCADGEMAARRIDEGFQMVTVGQDLGVLGSGMAAAFTAARNEGAR
jgi:4-hydroxy-2-oxoheptanedioate aldolase